MISCIWHMVFCVCPFFRFNYSTKTSHWPLCYASAASGEGTSPPGVCFQKNVTFVFLCVGSFVKFCVCCFVFCVFNCFRWFFLLPKVFLLISIGVFVAFLFPALRCSVGFCAPIERVFFQVVYFESGSTQDEKRKKTTTYKT